MNLESPSKAPPHAEIKPLQKNIYNIGLSLSVLGALSFFSVFVTSALSFGDFTNFNERVRGEALRAVLGMGAMIGGSALMGLAARGLAGSGLLLDPRQARKDLAPWSKLSGQMTNDALNEVDVVRAVQQHLTTPAESTPVVKIRCRQCSALSREIAKFCDQCGAPLA